MSIRHLAYTSSDARDWFLSPYERRTKPRRKNLTNDESLLLEPPNRDIVLDKIVYKIRVTNLDANSQQLWSENSLRKNDRSMYHSAVNRFKSDSVARSKSFQEQGVKPLMRNSRFFVNRHNHFSDNSIDTMSQNIENIEITIQDVDEPVDVDAKRDASSSNRSPFKCSQERVKSGHILGRIFRRMRKISLGWRKSRCKIRRGE